MSRWSSRMGSSQSLSVTYVGAIGRDLLRVTNFVQPESEFPVCHANGQFGDVGLPCPATQVSAAFFARAAGLGVVYLLPFDRYRLDRCIFLIPQSHRAWIADPNIDRGDSDFDIRHAFTAGVTYDLPSHGAQRLAGGVGRLVARRLRPGQIGASQRPALFFQASAPRLSAPESDSGVPLELYGSGYPGGKIFNRAAFSAAPTGQQGNFGRNVLRGFGAAQADIGVQRHVSAHGESWGFVSEAEFFNILNHPNFGSPTTALTSPLFGRSTQTLATALGVRRRQWRLQPSLPDRRTALDPVGAEAAVLRL